MRGEEQRCCSRQQRAQRIPRWGKGRGRCGGREGDGQGKGGDGERGIRRWGGGEEDAHGEMERGMREGWEGEEDGGKKDRGGEEDKEIEIKME